MSYVADLEHLAELYGTPAPTAVDKVLPYVSDLHREYIEASPFALVATAGPEGLDCSPRGDPAPVARVADERTVHLPDRRGNNRLDSLRNIVVDGRIALLFLVPGVDVTLRVNGAARLSVAPDLLESFAMGDRLPRVVIEVMVQAVYTQCPKALIRSALWDPGGFREPSELPSVGRIMEWITSGGFDGAEYDAAYPQRVLDTIY